MKTAVIARPDTYGSLNEVELDYAQLLEGLEEQLDGNEWTTHNKEIGHMDLRSVYAKLDGPDLEAVISHIGHVQAFVAQKSRPFPGCLVIVSVVAMKDGSFNEQYIKLLEDMAQKNVKDLESSKLVVIQNFTMDDFAGIEADIARKTTFDISSTQISESIPNLFVRIYRENLMIEFYISNYAMKDETIIKITELIFSRYEQMCK